MRPIILTCSLLLLSNTATAEPESAASPDQRAQNAAAAAQPTTKSDFGPRHKIVYQNILGGRLNPLGLEDCVTITYQLRLYNSNHLLLKDSFIGLAVSPSITPADARIGGEIIVKPLAILKLRAGYYLRGYFGNFGNVAGFNSAHADHWEDRLDEMKDADLNYSTRMGELVLGAQLLAKVGPIALSINTTAYRFNARLEGDHVTFYHPTHTTMVPNNGWLLTNDTDLVYLSNFGLVAGIRGSLLYSIFEEKHYLPGESTASSVKPIYRVGPLVAYTFAKEVHPMFQSPTAIIIAGWYLKHPYRDGTRVSRGVPIIQIVFTFKGELFSSTS